MEASKIPKAPLGKLCTGKYCKNILMEKDLFEYQSSNKCIVLKDDELPIDIIGLQFDKKNSFNISYTLSKKALIIYRFFLSFLKFFLVLFYCMPG